jgi:hypothetical protein
LSRPSIWTCQPGQVTVVERAGAEPDPIDPAEPAEADGCLTVETVLDWTAGGLVQLIRQ